MQFMWGDKTEKNEIGEESYVACIGAYRVLVGNLRDRDHLGDPGIDGRIILRWILWK